MIRSMFAVAMLLLATLVPAGAPHAQGQVEEPAEMGDGRGAIAVRVPVLVPYALLSAAIGAELTPIEAPGGITVTASNVVLSGEDGRLTATADAMVGGEVSLGPLKVDMSTDGTIALSGVPQVGSDGKSLALTEVKGTADLTNEALSALLATAMPAIELALSAALTVDLAPHIDELRTLFDTHLSKIQPADAITLEFSDLDLSIAALHARDNGLEADVAIKMALTVDIGTN